MTYTQALQSGRRTVIHRARGHREEGRKRAVRRPGLDEAHRGAVCDQTPYSLLVSTSCEWWASLRSADRVESSPSSITCGQRSTVSPAPMSPAPHIHSRRSRARSRHACALVCSSTRDPAPAPMGTTVQFAVLFVVYFTYPRAAAAICSCARPRELLAPASTEWPTAMRDADGPSRVERPHHADGVQLGQDLVECRRDEGDVAIKDLRKDQVEHRAT